MNSMEDLLNRFDDAINAYDTLTGAQIREAT